MMPTKLKELKQLKLISIGIAPHDAWFCIGISPHGLISIGAIPHGLISIGLVPMGVVAVGFVSMGLLSAGMVTMGAVSWGRINMSLVPMNSTQVQHQQPAESDMHRHH